MDQFSLAAHLLSTHGGMPEIVWAVAGELLDEGIDHREAFVHAGSSDIEARIRAHEDVLGRQN